MSLVERLRLDEVVTSFPELGPTAPDGGYSWFVFFGIIFIQITVPSVLSMYGTVLGYLASSSAPLYFTPLYFDLWNEKITLTPILFVAFWCLADPWTKIITDLASIPRLVGLIGVILLSTGVIASGYLATGGVGAYLASLSAGAVMGIGASFVMVESETVLRKHFRVKLPLVLTLKNIATSVGLTIVPALTHFLLTETGLKTGLLLMTVAFIPTAFGTLTLRSPPSQRASPYRLLLSTEEDNELGIRLSPDTETESEQRNDGANNAGYVASNDKQERNSTPLFSEVNNIYAYQDADEDVELFVSPALRLTNKWQQDFRVVRYFRFWMATITWIGVRAGTLFFYLLVPVMFLDRSEIGYHTNAWATLLIVAGIGSFVPSIASRWLITANAQYRKIHFAIACWLSGGVLIGLTYANTYVLFLTCSLIGGICLNSLLTCQDLTLCDVLGNQFVHYSRMLFSSFVGFGMLIFSFIPDEEICLYTAAVLLFIGGIYCTASTIWSIVQTWTRREVN